MKRKARTLQFANLDAAATYAAAINLERARTTGNWSLFEIFTHCAIAIECAATSFPRGFPVWIRRTVGRFSFWCIQRLGFFPPNVPNVRSVPAPGQVTGAAQARDRLLAAIRTLRNSAGPLAEHPFFGRLDRAEWENLHTWHLAHHLAFIDARGMADEL